METYSRIGLLRALMFQELGTLVRIHLYPLGLADFLSKSISKITLVSSGEDSKLHSFRLYKIQNYTRFVWIRFKITLVSSGEDSNLHSFRVEKIQNYTRFEWRRFTGSIDFQCSFPFLICQRPWKYTDYF